LVDEGPDDLFPQDPDQATIGSQTPERGEPEIMVGQQWGLRLPSGEVHWNMWQGVHFAHPIDRAKMVANIQKTLADIGLAPGEQTEEMLAQYQWVTRNQLATVVYEETGTYSLANPQAFALSAPEVDESSHGATNPENLTHASCASNGTHPDLDFRPGPLGGDAQ
jgi:hypothetical protein